MLRVAIVVAMAALAPAVAQTEAEIAIDPAATLGPVNRLVFGQNMLAYQGDAEYAARGAGVWDPASGRPNADYLERLHLAGATTLRWPGGCAAHEYNWKKTVGPLAERPDQPFGLSEFLVLCREVGAEPVLTVADYWGEDSDAADLVEYLNQPDDGSNPGGGTDWASVRASEGHPEPWAVRWFEVGNESDHGTHGEGAAKRVYSPERYAERYLAYRNAMRQVDPSIQVGAVLENCAGGDWGAWTRGVLRLAGPEMDFAITHPYLPRYYSEADPPEWADRIFAAALATPDQWGWNLTLLRGLMRELAGREIPLALTEFNGHFVQERPTPYRHCLGNALLNAELLHVFLAQGTGVLHAQHWQFANEYWGSVKGYAEPLTLRPNYHVFALYRKYLGDSLLDPTVRCATYETAGGWGVLPHTGAASEGRVVGEELLPAGPWRLSDAPGVTQTEAPDGGLEVSITAPEELNYYHARKTLPAEPNAWYRVTCEARVEGLAEGTRGAQIQLGDARGWTATKSVALSSEARPADWTTLTADYLTLPDTKEIEVVARRIDSAGAVRLSFRRVSVHRYEPMSFGAAPLLDVCAMRDSGTGRLSVLVVNRDLAGPVTATVRVAGATPRTAMAEALTGPAVDSTNDREPDTVRVAPLPVEAIDGGFRVVVPPHSLTALALEP